MKKLFVVALACLGFSWNALAAESGIRFDSVITENGKPISSPSILVAYGQDAVIEVPKTIRIVANAQTPNGDISHVKARMYYYSGKGWILDWDTSMDANITMTPSFEHNLGDHSHRIVLMPRKLVSK
jgi:hypothetical protein